MTFDGRIKICVTCYSGYRGEETPRRIRMGSNDIGVVDVQDRWLSPDHRYFKLVGTDQAVYIIRHDMNSLEWELTYFKHSDARAGVET